ncbi:MAG: biotin/lipoyl-binding protein [Nitrospiraceae bacterium]
MKQILVALLLLTGCGSKEEPATRVVSAAPQKTIQVAVVEAQSTSVPIRVEVAGQVAPIFQTTLSSRIQGTIDKLLVREGSRVSKGQLLIQLDSRDLQADLARAHAEVENAKAHLDRMNRCMPKMRSRNRRWRMQPERIEWPRPIAERRRLN